MTADILQFGDMTFTRKREQLRFGKEAGCPHRKLTLDDEGDIVTCDDCGKQVSAYWALRHFVGRWQKHKHDLEYERDKLNKEMQVHLHLIAARRLEIRWQSRSMLPACPHCYRGILQTDEFRSVNKEMELARRKAEAQPPKAPEPTPAA
jgi:hypothetical protein